MRPFALRHHYRFPVFGPVHCEHANREGYGTVMNVLQSDGEFLGLCPKSQGTCVR